MLGQKINGDLKVDLKLAKPFDMIMRMCKSGKWLRTLVRLRSLNYDGTRPTSPVRRSLGVGWKLLIGRGCNKI